MSAAVPLRLAGAICCAAALALASLVPLPLAAETAAPFTIAFAKPAEPVAVTLTGQFEPPLRFESSPLIIDQGKDLLATTAATWSCRSQTAFSPATVIALDRSACRLVTVPSRVDRATGRRIAPADLDDRTPWRRDYDGVMAAAALPGGALLLVRHGENKNENIAGAIYQNTVDPGVDARRCASGVLDGQYQDCWAAYHAFIAASYAAPPREAGLAAERLVDLGPVLWPSTAYLAPDGRRLSGGVRQPSAVADGGYLYIFYNEASDVLEPGREGGEKLARARLSEIGQDGARFVPLFNGGFDPQNRSLPPGFDRAHIAGFYDRPGGRAAPLWPGGGQVIYFSVARLRGTALFLGIEESGGFQGQPWGLRLRLSADLVQWSPPVAIPGDAADTWPHGQMHYPRLCDMTGRPALEIDPAHFLVLGAATDQQGVLRQELGLHLPAVP
jgi:hypothetical protein